MVKTSVLNAINTEFVHSWFSRPYPYLWTTLYIYIHVYIYIAHTHTHTQRERERVVIEMGVTHKSNKHTNTHAHTHLLSHTHALFTCEVRGNRISWFQCIIGCDNTWCIITSSSCGVLHAETEQVLAPYLAYSCHARMYHFDTRLFKNQHFLPFLLFLSFFISLFLSLSLSLSHAHTLSHTQTHIHIRVAVTVRCLSCCGARWPMKICTVHAGVIDNMIVVSPPPARPLAKWISSHAQCANSCLCLLFMFTTQSTRIDGTRH